MMNEEKWCTIAGNRFFVKDRKILYGEKHFLGDVHDLYLYQLDKKTGKYKPIPTKKRYSTINASKKIKRREYKIIAVLN